MKTKIIKISKDYTTAPGARYEKNSPYSGERFRKEFIEPIWDKDINTHIEIDLDGGIGYGCAFLEEVFGGLVRKYGDSVIKSHLKIVSEEEPELINEINHYVSHAFDKIADSDNSMKDQRVTIDYTNYRGERKKYDILPEWMYFGSNEYHTEPQWLLKAKVYDKEEVKERNFAVKDIHKWGINT